MEEKPPETSPTCTNRVLVPGKTGAKPFDALCTAGLLVPGKLVTAIDQLETVLPFVSAATPVITEPVSPLLNQYTTLASWRLVGLAPERTGEVAAVPSKTSEPLRSWSFGEDMTTLGKRRAMKSAVKIRLDCMTN